MADKWILKNPSKRTNADIFYYAASIGDRQTIHNMIRFGIKMEDVSSRGKFLAVGMPSLQKYIYDKSKENPSGFPGSGFEYFQYIQEINGIVYDSSHNIILPIFPIEIAHEEERRSLWMKTTKYSPLKMLMSSYDPSLDNNINEKTQKYIFDVQLYQKQIVESSNGIGCLLMNEFITEYQKQYDSELFKNPYSLMREKILHYDIKTIDDILEHALYNIECRSYQVLSKILDKGPYHLYLSKMYRFVVEYQKSYLSSWPRPLNSYIFDRIRNRDLTYDDVMKYIGEQRIHNLLTDFPYIKTCRTGEIMNQVTKTMAREVIVLPEGKDFLISKHPFPQKIPVCFPSNNDKLYLDTPWDMNTS